jgi:hypothetical protein
MKCKVRNIASGPARSRSDKVRKSSHIRNISGKVRNMSGLVKNISGQVRNISGSQENRCKV